MYTGFIQIFGTKIQDFFPYFFPNNNFFFQTEGYQIGDKQNKVFFIMNSKRKGEIE